MAPVQLALFLVVLAALSTAQFSRAEPVTDPAVCLALTLAGFAGVSLFALITSAVTVRRLRSDFSRRAKTLRRFDRLRQIHVGLWLLMSSVTLYGLGWDRLVRFNWHLAESFLADDLLILLPLVAPLLFSWATFYDVDRHLQSLSPAKPTRPASRRQYVRLHISHHLGLVLVPVLLLLSADDAVRFLVPSLSDGERSLLVAMGLLPALLVFFPDLLRRIWQTQPLPTGPLRDPLMAAARRWNMPLRDILLWQTGGLVVNAAVAGLVRRRRYVFLTDGLLERLSDEQVEDVFAHEMGHVHYRHLPLRLVAVAAPVGLWMVAASVFSPQLESLNVMLAAGGPAATSLVGLLAIAAIALYAWFVFGPYARLLENQADLFACRVMSTANSSPGHAPDSVAPASVACYGRMLAQLAVAAGVETSRGGWLHPSIDHRVQWLVDCAVRPGRTGRFEALIWFSTALLVSLCVGAVVGCWVVDL